MEKHCNIEIAAQVSRVSSAQNGISVPKMFIISFLNVSVQTCLLKKQLYINKPIDISLFIHPFVALLVLLQSWLHIYFSSAK